MTILDRYIGLAVFKGTLLALAVLLSLLGFVSFVDELDEVGNGRYGVLDAFVFVLLTLPHYTFELFPVSALLGSLIGLGTMTNASELIAMRSAGVSMARILWSVMKTGIAMMVVAALIGEVLAPDAEQEAQRLRAAALAETISIKTNYGFWARDGQAFINIRRILPDSRLEEIYIYEFGDDNRLSVATHADSAYYQDNRWVLTNIRQSRFTKTGVEARELGQATWSSLLNPSLLSVVVIPPEVLPVWGLYRYIRFLEENAQASQNYEVALWGKLLTPLVTLVMLFLSLPFICGSLRQIGIGQRVFIGIMIGIVFFLMNKAFAHMAVVYGLNPLLSAALPGLIFLGVGVWLTRRVR
jgi:lipopolysaccharide export system permease protein